MNEFSNLIKNKLLAIIEDMAASPASFVKNPNTDFTRNRQLNFQTVIRLLISMGGNSTTKELLDYFMYDEKAASSSAFIQQKSKIQIYAFEYLLKIFTLSIPALNMHEGYRLLAVDGTDLNIYHKPKDIDTYIRHTCNDKGYNALHLNVLYDLCNKVYLDAIVQPGKQTNERQALIQMVDRGDISENVIVMADRGYESYNVFEHIRRKGWHYIIRVKDITSNGIVHSLPLPDSDEFDTIATVRLTRKQNKEVTSNPQLYRYLAHAAVFDYLAPDEDYFSMTFRVLRFKISENNYETLITSLPQASFSLAEIKSLYGKRWGVETSFRKVKYAIGLTSFHSKKVEYITQEIFARLIMYNFCEMITMHVILSQKQRKYAYQANFTIAILICKHFFRCRENEIPPNIEALIQKNILPIREGRQFPRNIRRRRPVSFTYRVA